MDGEETSSEDTGYFERAVRVGFGTGRIICVFRIAAWWQEDIIQIIGGGGIACSDNISLGEVDSVYFVCADCFT
jgi:hypothetical protein